MPTITIGANSGNTFSGVADANIQVGTPTTNFGTADYLEMHRYGVGNHGSGLIKFTGITNIPAGSTITAASLSIYIHNGSVGGAIGVRRLLRNWVEAEVTWNIYSTGNSWTTAGALSDGNDRIASETGTPTTPSGLGAYVVIPDLQADVQGWLDATFSNYGWVATRTGTTANDSVFWTGRSSNHTDGERPYLTVTYTEPSGVVPSLYVNSSGIVNR